MAAMRAAATRAATSALAAPGRQQAVTRRSFGQAVAAGLRAEDSPFAGAALDAKVPAFTGASCQPPAEAAQVGAGIGRLSNMVLERGEGSWVWTVNGEKYLDFACGIGVTNLGHCHPRVKAAVQAQVDKLWHAQVNISHHEQMLGLTQRLQKSMPSGSQLDSFLFVTTGSEAVEAAIKLARHATGKPNVIVFQGGYHGRTLLAGSMTTSKTIYRGGYGPHNAGIHMAPYPYFNERLGCTIPDHTAWTLAQLELMLVQQTSPQETAAIIIESVLGEGGYLPPPPGLLAGLRELCDRHGLLFIADEVQSGFGRTGKMFAVELENVHPDILVFAKGIASGFPLAGIASRKELTDRQPGGSQGGTYAGNAVACAAANATLEVMSEPGFLAQVEERGRQLSQGLRDMQTGGPSAISGVIADVRGPGLMIGVEFNDLGSPKVEKGFAQKVAKACLDRGLIALPTGIFETMRLIPPLTISAEEIDEGLRIFQDALVASCQ